MKRNLIGALICAVALSGARGADAWKLPPETVKFKPGPGVELAVANCALCHSADYISTQPRLTSAAWKATVEKMRAKYGAPIATNNIAPIVEYLTSTFGTPAQ
ncbi:MAG TPA: cytochrome c [Burkholderiales bacterium]|nr:cytochrome c [Burkholderiales bacterium]